MTIDNQLIADAIEAGMYIPNDPDLEVFTVTIEELTAFAAITKRKDAVNATNTGDLIRRSDVINTVIKNLWVVKSSRLMEEYINSIPSVKASEPIDEIRALITK